ncbi:uncharacterized protein LOC142620456 [Castanea sativa]|uniref:uncharacterized protein LOC142620456 n=1 Tax=Castanea sativa TaxID=21020 RepID=UPI003F65225E
MALFFNKDVLELLDHRHIKHHKATPYYPQGNGHAEATNRVLLRILSKMGMNMRVAGLSTCWKPYTHTEAQAKIATGLLPFSLVYGTEAMSPIELLVPTPRVVHGQEIDVDAATCAKIRTMDLETLEETRNLAYNRT